MSEHQIIAFRAIDKPVSKENLAFMEEQSSRAEITPWAFDNEYHYGDFRGDHVEMLRRGYDIFFHYADFGYRNLHIRFPNGVPDTGAIEPYLLDDDFAILPDKKGPGYILNCTPFYEENDYLGNVHELVDAIVDVRQEILDGDFRALYIMRLVVGGDSNHDDEEITEGPLPAGLDDLTDAQQALCEWFDLHPDIVRAAALGKPTIAKPPAPQFEAWLTKQSAKKKDEWLKRFLEENDTALRSELLAMYRQDHPLPKSTTTGELRTIAYLFDCGQNLAQEAENEKKRQAAEARRKYLATVAADPKAMLQRADKLMSATKGNSNKYAELVPLLVDLHEALATTPQANLVLDYVAQLREQFPSRKTFFDRLRAAGFPKK